MILFFVHTVTQKIFVLKLQLCGKLKQYLAQAIIISQTTPQSSTVGFFDITEHSILINHLFLIFKFHVFNSRMKKQLNFESFKIKIKKIKTIEKNLTGPKGTVMQNM